MIQSAIYATDDRTAIKASTKTYFQSHRVKLGSFKLLLGSLFRADIRTDDHYDAIATATFGALGDYLSNYDLAQERFEIVAGE